MPPPPGAGSPAVPEQTRLLVGAGGCGLAVGADRLLDGLSEEIERRRLPIAVVAAGCTGMCHAAAQVTLQRPTQPDLTWNRVDSAAVPTLVAVAAGEAEPGRLPGAFAWTGEPVDGVSSLSALPFLAGQVRHLLEHVGRVDPVDLDEALARGRFHALAHALAQAPEAVVEEVKRSGLAGRGGAYFPAAIKWEGARRGGVPRILVVNAEEGEPGVFKDRHLIEGDPYLVVEGVLIAAYAIGADHVIFYLNGQARLARQRLAASLREIERRGFLGDSILGTGFACRIEVRSGAGGYVLGEESVILESVEGSRPMPRVRPPFPTEAGLWQRPTVINNAETLANLPLILDRGAAWFADLGSPRAPGTKLLSLSGDLARPGLVEIPIGTPLRTVVEDLAGGVPGGRAIQAILTGGPSGNLVPPSLLDTPLEPRHPEVLLGSGNLAVIDETRSLLDVVRRLTHFNAEESCGKCTPCREGVNRMREILDRVAAGDTRPSDRADLLDLCEIAASASLCGLGQMAPNPVVTALRHFALPGLADTGQGSGVRT